MSHVCREASLSGPQESSNSHTPHVSRRHRHREKVSTVLQMRMLKTKMCRWAQQGKCERGETCFFAHTAEELRRCPDLSMTRMCVNFGQTGSCANGDKCKFAHCEAELRGTTEFYRTAICEEWKKGVCKLDAFCRFAHGSSQLHPRAGLEECERTSKRGEASPATTASTPDSTPHFSDKQRPHFSPSDLLAAALAQADLDAATGVVDAEVDRSDAEAGSCDDDKDHDDNDDDENADLLAESLPTAIQHPGDAQVRANAFPLPTSVGNPQSSFDFLQELVARLAIEDVYSLLRSA